LMLEQFLLRAYMSITRETFHPITRETFHQVCWIAEVFGRIGNSSCVQEWIDFVHSCLFNSSRGDIAIPLRSLVGIANRVGRPLEDQIHTALANTVVYLLDGLEDWLQLVGGTFSGFSTLRSMLRLLCFVGEKLGGSRAHACGFILYHVHDDDDDDLRMEATKVLQLLSYQEEDTSGATSEIGLQSAVGSQAGAAELVAEEEVESDPVMIHQQDLHEAIMRSKEDQAPISYDGSVVVLRLTRCCEETWQALSESAALKDARDCVEEAGCSIFPHNANGACVLVPLTDEQLLELNLRLEKYHVLANRSLRTAIEEALRMVPRGIRPKLRDDHRAGLLKEELAFAQGSQVAASGGDTFLEIELLNPLTSARLRQFLAFNRGTLESLELSSASTVVESAPCSHAGSKKQCSLSNVNPRHWK